MKLLDVRNQESVIVDIQDYAQGIYLLKTIDQEGQISVQEFVKQ